jgi:hypothetical protein
LKAGAFPISVGAVLSDQQIGGAPNVEAGNHRLPRSISRPRRFAMPAPVLGAGSRITGGPTWINR